MSVGYYRWLRTSPVAYAETDTNWCRKWKADQLQSLRETESRAIWRWSSERFRWSAIEGWRRHWRPWRFEQTAMWSRVRDEVMRRTRENLEEPWRVTAKLCLWIWDRPFERVRGCGRVWSQRKPWVARKWRPERSWEEGIRAEREGDEDGERPRLCFFSFFPKNPRVSSNPSSDPGLGLWSPIRVVSSPCAPVHGLPYWA